MLNLRRAIGLVLSLCFSAAAWAQPAGSNEVIVRRHAVAADHPLASQAGLEILQRGGNAVDAAVATSFTLAVVRPFSCGIGGGGFMLVYKPASANEPATAMAINYREVAPAGVGPDYFTTLDVPEASRYGPHAVAVPGTVAGLLWALDRFGTLDRAAVLAPAIRAAEDGFAIDAHHVKAAHEVAGVLDRLPHMREQAQYVFGTLCFSGEAKVGDVLKQPALAKALRLIAEEGADAFYRGAIGEALVRRVDALGGAITAEDLQHFQPRITAPLEGMFHGRRVLAMPPPSSGGIAMLETLGIIERTWDRAMPQPWPIGGGTVSRDLVDSPQYVHLVTEAMKHAFADRAAYLADDRFADVPTARLRSREYISRLSARVAPRALDDPYAYGSVTPAAVSPREDSGTSHFCVIDSAGMAVACTETINLEFGSLVAVDEFGIVLNNEMDDFTTIPGAPNAFGLTQSDRNLPAAGKNPVSSMSPTIVVDGAGKVSLIAGASGGPRIISATLECVLDALLFGMAPGEAVEIPRFHHQWMPNVLELEDRWPAGPIDDALGVRGHTVQRTERGAAVQMIGIMPDGTIRAASDPRKSGKPAGE